MRFIRDLLLSAAMRGTPERGRTRLRPMEARSRRPGRNTPGGIRAEV